MNYNQASISYLIRQDQTEQYPNILNYFSESNVPGKDIPNLVQQLNIFIDSEGVLRVGSKIARKMRTNKKYCPILLSKKSLLTELVVREFHTKQFHSGIYSILAEFRKMFYVPCCFSVIKNVIKTCVHCKRFNARTIKNNQGPYRNFRIAPNDRHFSTVALDYAGPFRVKVNSEVVKVYVLVITCLFTRAVNLEISLNMTTKEFIRSFQLHTFKYGLPGFVLSDSGSNIVSAADVIRNFISEADTVNYLNQCGSKLIEFHQYFKGKHELGSLVEICVKMSKRLISGAIKNNVLLLREFEFVIANAVHLINRRPIALKDSLRDKETDVPEVITPEQLIHGFTLPSVNIIPSMQGTDVQDVQLDKDYDPVEKIKDVDEKLRKIRSNLISIYNAEFLPQLITQATNEKSRYKPVTHKPIGVGDIVLLKEDHTKQSNYPMARVKKITLNELGEVTGATVFKGRTKETVKRHSSVIIPLLHDTLVDVATDTDAPASSACDTRAKALRVQRAAATESERRTRAMLNE